METFYFILIGIAAGWLGTRILKGGGFGNAGDYVVGILGAILGGYLPGLLGFGGDGALVVALVVAAFVAVLMIILVRVLRSTRRA